MSDTNGDHEHEDAESDGEIAITFHPREEDLEKLGITLQQFEDALLDALDTHDGLDPESAPAFEEIMIEVAGQQVRLGDIADVEMSATLDELDGEEDDEFDDEDDEEDELDEDEETKI